jgi:hypothetical protein
VDVVEVAAPELLKALAQLPADVPMPARNESNSSRKHGIISISRTPSPVIGERPRADVEFPLVHASAEATPFDDASVDIVYVPP